MFEWLYFLVVTLQFSCKTVQSTTGKKKAKWVLQIKKLVHCPTRSDIYFDNNEQAPPAVFTASFCFAHAEHNFITSFWKFLILSSWALSIYAALEIEKLVLVGKMLWRFDIIFHILLMH